MLESFSAIGFLVHTPCGPRKSGMPESVEMPAPVSATTRFAPSIQPLVRSSFLSKPPKLQDRQPAVDREHSACHEACFLGGEPEDRPGDLLGRGPAPEQRV